MFIYPPDLTKHYGKVVDNGHCVRFAQAVVPGVPHTSHWRRGAKVRGGDIPPGAVIATFDASGRYANAVDGSSHAAILLDELEDGLLVADQWVGQPVHERVIKYRGGSGLAVNDGDLFYVVET